MEKLYYGTDEFEVLEFSNRKVIDEINMSMSAFNCMLPDHAGIYCSSELTTGKRFYQILKKYGASSEPDLKAKLGEEEVKRIKDELLQANIARGTEFTEKLRERGFINVVTPGPYKAKCFEQEHYLYLWELFIIKKIYEARFNYDWEYSNGCTLEYAIAARKGIPRLDHEGAVLDLASAIERVGAALNELQKEGFVVNDLEQNLARMKAIQQ